MNEQSMVDRMITTNFGLLRWMHGTHKNLVGRLGSTSSWNKLSDYTLGSVIPDAYVRSSVETKLELSPGWTSRNNEFLLRLSESDFDLVAAIVQLDSKTKMALFALTEAIFEEAQG